MRGSLRLQVRITFVVGSVFTAFASWEINHCASQAFRQHQQRDLLQDPDSSQIMISCFIFNGHGPGMTCLVPTTQRFVLDLHNQDVLLHLLFSTSTTIWQSIHGTTVYSKIPFHATQTLHHQNIPQALF